MRASLHALQRWEEYDFEGDILDAFENAQYVGDDFQEKEHVEYYALDDMLFVVDSYTKTIITIIKAHYGFSEEINRSIAHKQIKLIRKLMSDIEIQEARLVIKENEFAKRLEVYDADIKRLEEQVKSLKCLRNAVQEETEGHRKGINALRQQHIAELRKLHYSINYRIKNLTLNNREALCQATY